MNSYMNTQCVVWLRMFHCHPLGEPKHTPGSSKPLLVPSHCFMNYSINENTAELPSKHRLGFFFFFNITYPSHGYDFQGGGHNLVSFYKLSLFNLPEIFTHECSCMNLVTVNHPYFCIFC